MFAHFEKMTLYEQFKTLDNVLHLIRFIDDHDDNILKLQISVAMHAILVLLETLSSKLEEKEQAEIADQLAMYALWRDQEEKIIDAGGELP